MPLLNRGRKLFYLTGVVLSGGHIVIRGISVTLKSHFPYRRIDKLKITIAMLDQSFLWPAYWPLLHWLFYSRAGSRRARGSWCWFEIVWDHPWFMKETAKINFSPECCLFMGISRGLGVALLIRCRLRVFMVPKLSYRSLFPCSLTYYSYEALL